MRAVVIFTEDAWRVASVHATGATAESAFCREAVAAKGKRYIEEIAYVQLLTTRHKTNIVPREEMVIIRSVSNG